MAVKKIKPVPVECASNAVIYLRYSSDKQTENSIDGQRRICYEYCAQKGFNIISEYAERAISGTSDDRPEFQRMIDDSKKQQFAFIVVYRFDRFARSKYDSTIYKKELEDYGVRVLSATEHVGDGDEGRILEAIYEAMDENYSRRLSRITKRGMREAAFKGLWTGGNVPLGYKVEDRKLVIDPKTALIIQLIFKRYSEGRTKTQIAAELNENGYRTKQGKEFNCSNFSTIISNKMYYGCYDFDDVKRNCPAIITKEEFDKVQDMLSANKRCFGRKVSDAFFALSGKAFCGHCGAALIGDCGTSRNGSKHYYYTCGKKKKVRKSCDKKSEQKIFLEWYVCAKTVEYVLNPERIKVIAKNVAESAKKNSGSGREEALEKQLRNIDRELEKVVDAIVNTSVPAVIKKINERAETLEKQQKAVEAELASIRLHQELQITAADVESFLLSLKKGDLSDEDFRRRLINTLVNCVYVFDDKVVIYYNIRNMKQVSFPVMISDLDSIEKNQDTFSPSSCSDSTTQGEPKKSRSSERDFFIQADRLGISSPRGVRCISPNS